VNYFNPAFSWQESLFGPSDLQKTLSAFPIVRLQLSSTNRDETARSWLARIGQLHLEPFHGCGLERTVPSVSARGILSPLPGDRARDDRPCDYDIRHNLNAQYGYQLPVRVRNHSLGYALNRWQISGTAFWHSGVPLSVLSTPYVKRTTMTRVNSLLPDTLPSWQACFLNRTGRPDPI